jgi:hypothetical protein
MRTAAPADHYSYHSTAATTVSNHPAAVRSSGGAGVYDVVSSDSDEADVLSDEEPLFNASGYNQQVTSPALLNLANVTFSLSLLSSLSLSRSW